jgi:hypothetical protein
MAQATRVPSTPRTTALKIVAGTDHTPENSQTVQHRNLTASSRISFRATDDQTLTITQRNKRLRKERDLKWCAASARAEVLRAQMEMHTKVQIAQMYRLPEVRNIPAVDPADYSIMLEKYRKARMDMLLTPAPDARALIWKRQHVERLVEWDWVGVKPEQVERAIADDEAFLKAHPVRSKCP